MVHWDRERYRRRLISQILLLSGLIALFVMVYHDEETYAHRESAFRVLKKFEVPLKEISGLALLPGKGGAELAFVGDRKAEILEYSQPGGQSVARPFKATLVDRFSLCRTEEFEDCKKMIKKLVSNWEALSVDASGRYFVLQEHTQSVVILSPEARAIEKVVHFNFAQAFPELVSQGAKKFRLNSLGEGMVLLKNGHILIAKEQYPLAFVEFGPEGDQPLGVHTHTVLKPEDVFSIPATESIHLEYQPLATWIVAGHSKCDFSDLAVDGQGRLLALSQSCRHVGVFDQLVPGVEPAANRYLSLPAEIASPEALAVRGDLWFVASDIPSKREYNFYILQHTTGL